MLYFNRHYIELRHCWVHCGTRVVATWCVPIMRVSNFGVFVAVLPNCQFAKAMITSRCGKPSALLALYSLVNFFWSYTVTGYPSDAGLFMVKFLARVMEWWNACAWFHMYHYIWRCGVKSRLSINRSSSSSYGVLQQPCSNMISCTIVIQIFSTAYIIWYKLSILNIKH